ncbi:MAG: peptidyl-prolyl cis-trans isomerase [Chromatiales bacterium]|nr:peptidyl-prolyl cis-trans isomerase [Chromatiales bacterium]
MAFSRRLVLALGLAFAAAGPAIAAGPTQVKVETSAGDFVMQLDEVRAPLTVANFLKYVNDGFYDGTIFHRVVNGFVIQGGGYTPDMTLKPPRPALVNESGNGLSNKRGSVAMARTAEPHSADSQFYVNLADNLALDPKPTRWGYAVFGEVVQGLDIVDEIGHRVTGNKAGMQDVPVEPVVIRKITVLKTPVAR